MSGRNDEPVAWAFPGTGYRFWTTDPKADNLNPGKLIPVYGPETLAATEERARAAEAERDALLTEIGRVKEDGWPDALTKLRAIIDSCLAAWDADEQSRAQVEALTRRVAELEGGIQAYLDGNYDHPHRHRPRRCEHGVVYYDDCSECDARHFRALLPASEESAPGRIDPSSS